MLRPWFYTLLQPCLSILLSPNFHFPPRVTQLNQLQWLVLWSVPSWDHAPSTVLGLLQLKQTTLVWLVAEPRCWDGSTCQSQAHHASVSLGAPEPKRNEGLLCCINVASLLFPIRFHLKYTGLSCWEHSTVCVGVWLHACVVQVGLGLLLSLSVSLHLSHDFPDSGSPGVSHLGHQLHSQVNCSSKWSAKQYRKKEKKIVIAMIHRRAHITSAWQDQTRKLAINKPMSGVRDLLKHLKWMKRIC